MITPVAVYLITHVILTLADPPTLDDLKDLKCTPEKPHLCIPYGYCCSGDEFCHKVDGKCQTCFPLNVTEENLLTWCRDVGQHDLTMMQHSSCKLACQFRFNTSQLVVAKQISAKQDSHKWDIAPLLVPLIISLIINIIVFSVLFCLWRRRGKSQAPVSVDIEAGKEEDSDNLLAATDDSDASKRPVNSASVKVGKNPTFNVRLSRILSQERDSSIENDHASMDKAVTRRESSDHPTSNPD